MWVHGVPFILNFKRSTFWHVPFTGDAQTFHHGDGLGMMTSVSRNWKQCLEVWLQVGIQFFYFILMILICSLLRFWWSHELAVPHLIETCHLFTYFVAQQNQVQTCLLLQVTLESTICLAWRLSHLVFVDHVLKTHCCLTTSYIHLPSILFLRACTDMVVSSLLFLLQSLGELVTLYFASIGVTRFLDDFVFLTRNC